MTSKYPLPGDENAERRRFTRFFCSRLACSCLLRLQSQQVAPGEGRRHSALLSDISADGISFETNFRPSDGEYLNLEVRPIEGPEVSARIRVLYSRNTSKNGFFIVGSQFAEMSERDKQNLLILLETVHRMEQDLKKS